MIVSFFQRPGFAVLCGALLCAGCSAWPSAGSREARAAEALAEGRPHLARLLLIKHLRQGELSPEAWVTLARASVQLDGPHAALSDVEAALEEGIAPGLLFGFPELAPLATDPAAMRAAARGPHPPPPPASFPAAAPGAVDAEALRALVEEAKVHHSSALVVLRDGALVGEWYFGHPRERIEAMSATKSFVSLAVGLLVADGRLSLDTRVAEYFAEWRGTPKEAITVRHLLNHTSGLKAPRTTEEAYRQKDLVRYALEAPLQDPPGTAFFYNNRATLLAAGVVAAAAGEPLDELLHRRLFAPLGISDVTWTRDAAGNRHGHAGLQIHPIDLAKVGQLIVQGGIWEGVRILPAEYLAELDKPAQPFDPTCGLLWWIKPRAEEYRLEPPFFAALRAEGVAEETIGKLLRYAGDPLPAEVFYRVLTEELRRFEAHRVVQIAREADVLPRPRAVGGTFGVAAQGYLGQVLFVAPEERLVVVRMSAYQRGVNQAKQEFSQVIPLSRRLVAPQWRPVALPGIAEERTDGR